MDFWKAVLALARRKLVILPLLGLAIVAALAGYSLTPLHYVSSATMVLAPPAFGANPVAEPGRAGLSDEPDAELQQRSQDRLYHTDLCDERARRSCGTRCCRRRSNSAHR